MKNNVRLTVLLLAALLALAIGPALADAAAAGPGDPMPDFTVTTAGGDSFTLSEALKTKKAVLVNFWATWCGPCLMEFPYMEEAYGACRDEVEIIALSVEPEDTIEMIRAFAEEYEISFPMASNTEAGLSSRFYSGGIPTSVLVDRYGNIVLMEVGAQTRVDAFTNAFELLISDAYTQSVVLKGFPGIKSEVEAEDDPRLAEAVGNPPFGVTSSGDPFAWPFLPAMSGDRSCLAASNTGRAFTVSEVLVQIDAKAGDAFVFDAALNTQIYYQKFVISLNGEKIRTFSGGEDWFTYAVALEEGRNVISLQYDKSQDYYDEAPAGGEYVYLDSFRLLSGGEAEEALAEWPAFPFADETLLTVTSPGAREVRFTDGAGGDTMFDLYGANTHAFIVYGSKVLCTACISDEYDPDDIFVQENCTGRMFMPYAFQNNTLEIPLNREEETGLTSTLVLMYNTLDYRIANLVIFVDEESADAFTMRLKNRGIETAWSFADSAEAAGGDSLPESVTYTVSFADQNGDPVPGCIINFCTDQICVPVKADENGIAVFEGAPYAYHLQVIAVPGGYAFDRTQEFTAPLLGGELSFTVERQ